MDIEIQEIKLEPQVQKIRLRRKRTATVLKNLKGLEENQKKKEVAQEAYYSQASALPKQPLATNNIIVKENLVGLEENKRKKQYAQKLYYKNISGESPMTREDASKGPVHARLGQKIRLFRKRAEPQNGMFTKKYKYMVQKYNGPRLIAQRRLEKLRQTMGGKPGGIVLRRRIPNLTVRVNNHNATQIPRHSVRGSVDPVLKGQIQTIQASMQHESIGEMPTHGFVGNSTQVPMNVRFSNLP